MKKLIVNFDLLKATLLSVLCSFFVLQGCQKDNELQDASILKNTSSQWNVNSFSNKSFEETNPTLKSASLSVVLNGGFEQGFNGWDVYAKGYGIDGDVSKAWYVGSTDPYNSFYKNYHLEPLAHSGNYGATAVGNGPIYHRMSQEVVIPPGAVELRFWIRWKNLYGKWDYTQNIQVILYDINTNKILMIPFSGLNWNLPMFSGGGNISKANYEQRVINISFLAGQKVRLDFVSEAQNWWMFVDFDDIEIIQVGYISLLDFKPGGDNMINLKSNGTLPVALLSDENFDATTLILSSITIGDDKKPETPIKLKNNGEYMASFEDVNNDGLKDLMMHFEIQDLINNGDLNADSYSLKLNGNTTKNIWVVAKGTFKVLDN